MSYQLTAYAPQQVAQYSTAGPIQVDPSRTQIWMGDLDPYMDEAYLKALWYQFGENVSVKVIRSKDTGSPSGYCFIEFNNAFSAHKFLHQLNGTVIPGTGKTFKLNWASGGSGGPTSSSDYPIFIGDIDPEVTDMMLYQLFASKYKSVRNARIVTDPISGYSKGYGFVRFGDEAESFRAIKEMNNIQLGNRPIRCSTANSRGGTTTGYNQVSVSSRSTAPADGGNNPNNTTVFIGGIDKTVTEAELRHHFQGFGHIHTVKIPQGKGFGFVSYYTHKAAEDAIAHMNGAVIGGARVKVSWGHSAVGPPVPQAAAASGGAAAGQKKQQFLPPPPVSSVIEYPTMGEMNQDYINREMKILTDSEFYYTSESVLSM